MAEFTEYDDEIQEEKKVAISVHLIVKRHLPPDAGKWPQEQLVSELNKVTHLRLDREHIGKMDNLEVLGDSVTNLYLQHNTLEKIENLDCLRNLRFITLSSNHIRRVEGLRHLGKLGFLDLSDNHIKRVHIEELPKSLVILSLKDNPCTDDPDHRLRITEGLPRLRQLDNVELTSGERQAAGHAVSSEEEEEEEEEEGEEEGLDVQKAIDEFYSATVEDVMRRAQDRQVSALQQHTARMDQLSQIREEAGLPRSRPATGQSHSATVQRSRPATAQRSPPCIVREDNPEQSHSAASSITPAQPQSVSEHRSKSVPDTRHKGSKAKR